MAEAKARRSDLLVALMLLSMIIWGGTWPSAKVLSPIAAPEVLVFWRFLITTIAFAPLLVVLRSSQRITPKGLAASAAAGLFLVVYNELFFAGLRTGLAGAGGVIVPALSPIFTFLFLLATRARRARWIEIGGLVLGVAGCAIILQPWSRTPGEMLASGNALFVVAAAAWSGVTLSGQYAQRDLSFVPFSLLAYGSATLFDLPFALRGGIGSVAGHGFVVWGNLLYLAVVATAFATSVFFVSAARVGSARTSSFMFVVPTAALLLSWFLIGERPAPATLAGGALSVAAVYLVNRRERAREQLQPAPDPR